MTVADTPEELLRNDLSAGKTLGIWGVRNYHTTLEKRAIAGGAMTGG